MKTAIMQPYFFPYIGYFQLIKAVDLFIVYDNIQYTKKGWINRNRFLQNGSEGVFSIPLKKDSDFLDVKDRHISAEFNKTKLLNQIREAYQKAPYFTRTFSIFEKVILNNDNNLFDYIFSSIVAVCKELSIETKILKSSEIDIDHNLKSQDKVIAICRHTSTEIYINSIGGQVLYTKEIFSDYNLELKFIKSNLVTYNQFGNAFIPWLSILDVMMFNSNEDIQKMLCEYELL